VQLFKLPTTHFGLRAMEVAESVDSRSAKRRASDVELDLENERVSRRRVQEELSEQRLRAVAADKRLHEQRQGSERALLALRISFRKRLEVAEKQADEQRRRADEQQRRADEQQRRADEAQRRSASAARRAAAADARAAVSESRAIAALQQAEARAAPVAKPASATAVPRSQPCCPICREEIYDENAWVLSCGHVMHEDCKRALVARRIRRCPECRRNTVER